VPLLLLVAAALLGSCGSSGSSDQSSASEAKVRLLPASELKPLVQDRVLAWDNPIDFVGQGIALPEGTPPSEAVKAMEDAGFSVGAGQQFVSKGGVGAHIDVAKFDSTDGARGALVYLHGQDLLHPCFTSCSVDTHRFTVKGVPGSTGVHQTPNGIKPPLGSHPFERDLAEFTIGEYLYVVEADGDPGSIPPARFDQGVEVLYQHAKQVH
jgi:hypothetical protein